MNRTYKSSEVVALALQGVAEPDIIIEVIHIQHQSPHSIPQLVSDSVLLVVERDPLDSGVRRLAYDGEGVVGDQP
jgi:hypothetical protein